MITLDKTDENLLKRRQELTDELATGPLVPHVLLARAEVYEDLGYPELAVADAYYALTLVETAMDPEFSDLSPMILHDGVAVPWVPELGDTHRQAVDVKSQAMELLMRNLAEVGCFQDALDYYHELSSFFTQEGEDSPNKDAFTKMITARYNKLHPRLGEAPSFEDLVSNSVEVPNEGLACREVYPWNTHEPDRTSRESLKVINEKLLPAAPALEARATVLPVLGVNGTETEELETCVQLGLFAKHDLVPGTAILHERSIITAIRPIDASLCDLCASPLPELSSSNPPIACPDCSTAVFCSETCLEYASAMYHRGPFCDNEDDVDGIGRDSLSKQPADDLYFLLVARTIAMAEAQNTHPLALFETQYLCGEFTAHSAPPSLPFTFMHTILLPFRFFTTLMLSSESITPYSPKWLDRYDHWIIQTLYAKFRSVASARQSTWDAKPEVAAVHPLWCLANHSCAPNVSWTWGESPEIVYRVREKPVWQREHGRRSSRGGGSKDDAYTGIKKDEEIMNHYVDVRLGVQERREYAMGPLGGMCRCERCLVESWEVK